MTQPISSSSCQTQALSLTQQVKSHFFGTALRYQTEQQQENCFLLQSTGCPGELVSPGALWSTLPALYSWQLGMNIPWLVWFEQYYRDKRGTWDGLFALSCLYSPGCLHSPGYLHSPGSHSLISTQKTFWKPKAEGRSPLSKSCQRGNHGERSSRDPTAPQARTSPLLLTS